MKISLKCPLCETRLYRKRLKIDQDKFAGLRAKGIIYKAVNFCISAECDFIEQGVLWFNGKTAEFLNLDELDILMKDKTKKK